MRINAYCFKWGKKYDPIYVNRLFKSVVKNYDDDVVFHCITDDDEGLHKDIEIMYYEDTRIPELNNIFTIEKLRLFDPSFIKTENNIIFDIDALILNNMTSYLKEYNFKEPRFIKNFWANQTQVNAYFHKGACDINSSFVTWKEDQFEYLYKFYIDNYEKINFLFKSFDKSLFGMFRDKLNYHPEKTVYAYNFGATNKDYMPAIFRKDYIICIFNTSHGVGKELHECDDWALETWETYDG